jgi:putative flippase GtrA
MRKLLQQIMKFGVVGVIAFGIDYGLLIALTELVHIDYLLSTTISFIVAVVFNYLASMRFVFAHKVELKRHHEFMIFVVLSVIGLGINDLAMWLGTDVLLIDYRLTKIVVTAIVMVFNFVTRKKFLDAGK